MKKETPAHTFYASDGIRVTVKSLGDKGGYTCFDYPDRDGTTIVKTCLPDGTVGPEFASATAAREFLTGAGGNSHD